MSVNSNISQRLQVLYRGVRDAAVKGVDRAGDKMLADAQVRTPVKTGALRDSAHAEPAALAGDMVSKRIGFAADYAAVVHEDLTAAHDNGEAKFLETTVRDEAHELGRDVADDVRSAMG